MLAQPCQEARPRISNVRTAKHATQRRVSRAARSRYRALMRFCAVLAVGLTLVMGYVTLTAHLTSLSYAVGRAQRERAALQTETARLDDQVAALSSDDRLARIAAKLKMKDPQEFALISLPPATRPADRSHLAFFTGLASLFRAK